MYVMVRVQPKHSNSGTGADLHSSLYLMHWRDFNTQIAVPQSQGCGVNRPGVGIETLHLASFQMTLRVLTKKQVI